MLSTETPGFAPPVWQYDLGDASSRLLVHGELDILTTPRLEDALSLGECWGNPIVVDLADLSFMDASGLHALASASRRAKDGGRLFAVVRCPPPVRRLFELIGMLGLLGDDVPQRTEAFSRG